MAYAEKCEEEVRRSGVYELLSLGVFQVALRNTIIIFSALHYFKSKPKLFEKFDHDRFLSKIWNVQKNIPSHELSLHLSLIPFILWRCTKKKQTSSLQTSCVLSLIQPRFHMNLFWYRNKFKYNLSVCVLLQKLIQHSHNSVRSLPQQLNAILSGF